METVGKRTSVAPTTAATLNSVNISLKDLPPCLIFSLQMKKGDRGPLHALDQEWDSLQVNQHQVQDLNPSS